MRCLIVLLTAWFAIGLHGGTALAEEPARATAASGAAAAQPDAFFPQPNYRFDAVLEGAVVMHDFVLHNRGGAPLSVDKVETS